jgi:hypothetical protein
MMLTNHLFYLLKVASPVSAVDRLVGNTN